MCQHKCSLITYSDNYHVDFACPNEITNKFTSSNMNLLLHRTVILSFSWICFQSYNSIFSSSRYSLPPGIAYVMAWKFAFSFVTFNLTEKEILSFFLLIFENPWRMNSFALTESKFSMEKKDLITDKEILWTIQGDVTTSTSILCTVSRHTFHVIPCTWVRNSDQ